MNWNIAGRGNATSRPRKQYSTATQKRLSELKNATWNTLGTNKLHILCQTPEGELQNDWIALHMTDFYNELQILAEIATTHEDAEQFALPGKGFPRGFVYKWKEGKGKKAQSVSGPDYINFSLAYIENVLNDGTIFPGEDPPEYKENFIPEVKKLYVKMFRIFAILYGAFLETMKKVEVKEHLNTSFKHFMFFSFAHGLTPSERELTPMEAKVKEFKAQYIEGMKKDKNSLNKYGRQATMNTMEIQI